MFKKILTTLALVLLCVLCAHAQLLWRVEGKQLAQPSYLLGTYHLAPAAYADSIPGLQSAIKAVGQVYGELDMNEESKPEYAAKIEAATTLPDGKTLDQLLTADQMKRLNDCMKQMIGTDLTNPMLAPMKQMMPAALTVQLQVYLGMMTEPGFNPTALLDNHVQQLALKQGKTIGGLETIDEQIKVLFGTTPLKRQTEQLMCFVDHLDYQKDLVARTSQAYRAQDIDRLYGLIVEKLGNSCDTTPDEEEALIYGRNAAWATKLPALMQAKSTLVAVGAGHLPGDRGLISLLRQQGYTVTAVK